MTDSQTLISILSSRIISAYLRSRREGDGELSTKKAAMAAAALLLQTHLDDEAVPLDPELYVASQSKRSRELSPWFDLATPAAAKCYVRCVRKIVRSLRKEIQSEIDRAEEKIGEGESVYHVLMKPDPKLSGMTRYLLAHRFRRPALANRFLHEAVAQHRSCPLYKQATCEMLSRDLYPDESMLERCRFYDLIRELQKEKENIGLTQLN